MNFLVDFELNKKCRRKRKKIITREEHPGRVAHGHKLVALMEKRKAEILHTNKQYTVQSTEQSTEQSSVQSTEQPSVQSTVQSNYLYGVDIFAVFAISIGVFFAYNTFQPKKQANENQDQPPKRRHIL